MEESLKIRHERSAAAYPHLNLGENEYVELEFHRATICYVLVWIAAISATILLTLALFVMNADPGAFLIAPIPESSRGYVMLVAVVLYMVFGLSALITTRVLSGNRLYVTNKRAIQYEMLYLLSNSVNVIELRRIEDVSFRQTGLFAHIFGVGTIRMSTVGDETTYTFKYVYKPTAGEIETLTNLVARAKRRYSITSTSERSDAEAEAELVAEDKAMRAEAKTAAETKAEAKTDEAEKSADEAGKAKK